MAGSPPKKVSLTVARSIEVAAGIAAGVVLAIGAISALTWWASEKASGRAEAERQLETQAAMLSQRIEALRHLSRLQATWMVDVSRSNLSRTCVKGAQSLIDTYPFVQGAGLVDSQGRPGACFIGGPLPTVLRELAAFDHGGWRLYQIDSTGALLAVETIDALAGQGAAIVATIDLVDTAQIASPSTVHLDWGADREPQHGLEPSAVVRQVLFRGAELGTLRTSSVATFPRGPAVLAALSAVAALVTGILVRRRLRAQIGRPSDELFRLSQLPLHHSGSDPSVELATVGALGPCFDALTHWRAQCASLASRLGESERQLLDCKTQLQVLQREARIGFWETDLTTGRIRWSPQTYAIFGIPLGEAITLNRLRAMMPPAEADRFLPEQAAAVEGVSALDLVHRIVLPDGSEKIVHERGRLDLEADGSAGFLRGTVMDVTATHRARLESDMLRQVAKVSRQALALCKGTPGEPNGRVIMCNPRFEALFAVSGDAQELAWSRLWQQGDASLAGIADKMKQSLAGDQPTEFDVVWERDDGTRIHLALQLQPLHLARWVDPLPTWALIIRDVTEHRLAEQARAESEQRYRELFDHHPLPMWVYDPQSLKIVDANQRAVETYGYSAERFRSMTLLDIRPPEEADRLRAAIRSMPDRPAMDGPWRHRRADGSELIVEAYSGPVHIGGRKLRVVCPVDRSAEVAAKERLRSLNAQLDEEIARRSSELATSERRYRALAELSPAVIWQAQKDGRVTYLNPSWLAIVGGSMEDWLGVGWLTAIVADDRERVEAAFREALQTKARVRIQRRVIDSNGRVRHLLGTACPIFDEHGDVEAWIGVDTDVTDLIHQREELDALNDELEAFAYSVSHDLRAPLDAVRGFASCLASGKLGHVDVEAQRYLDRISANAIRMEMLIQSLLRLSQIGRQSLHIEPVNLHDLVETIVGELDEQHAARDIAWRLSINEVIEADRGLMRLALENLLSNAVKFTAQKERTEIDVVVRRHDTEIEIVVTDNGVGFPAAHADRLFRPFRRLHSRRSFPGLGLGLAIVDRVARRHGGRVSGRNEPSGGATFTLCLPLRAVDRLDAPSVMEVVS